MTTTICLINQKGGCGKSSTCFHLSAALSKEGRSVLLVDADPQGSLSQAFFGSTFVETLLPEETLAALFDKSAANVDAGSLVRQTPLDGIAVVAANQHLAPFNVPQPETLGMRQYALREMLDELPDFDVVLIDCPPNLYLCSWTAMVAADYVIIPVPPEDFGTQGLRAVHQAIDNARHLNPALSHMGHLVTRCDRRLLVHQAYEARLRELYGPLVLETVIPEASAFKVALACRKPVGLYSPRSKAADLTDRLAREILDKVAEGTGKRHVA